MAQDFIDVGAAPNNNAGTPARTAGQIINANFSELYARFVVIGGNVFGFRKKPGNNGAGYEVGDVIVNGFWDANDYIIKADFLGGDETIRANWQDVDLSAGTDGKSAYQIWLDNGNSGSETTFLNSLIGADGADGAQGAQGAPGADGVDGAPGGTEGPAGTDGLSAFDLWLLDGNSGTVNDFLDSLKGADAVPLGSIEVDGLTITIKDAEGNTVDSAEILIDFMKIDSPHDATGKWVVGRHPNILNNKLFAGLSNAATPTLPTHIDEYLIVK